MKKTIIVISLIATLFLINSVFSQNRIDTKTTSIYGVERVLAASPTPAATEAWVEGYYCDPTLNRQKFTDVKTIVKSPWPDKSSFFTDAKLDPYCIDTTIVGTLYDYNFGAANISNQHGYCAKGYTTAYDAVDDLTNLELMSHSSMACCTAGFPYLVSEKSTVGGGEWVWEWKTAASCCNKNGALRSNGSCSDGAAAKPYQAATGASLGEAAFPKADKVYSCPPTACFVESTAKVGWTKAGGPRDNITEAKKSKYHCVESVSGKDDAANIVPDKYCFAGDIYTKEEFAKWSGMLGAVSTCKSFVDQAQVKACLKCYEPCSGQDDCSLNYNGLGCIDTTPNGLITRVFQIGIGVIGVVGILQVMYAAMLRQTADPAKIQESWDIVTSLIVGMVLLLGATVILKFIGMDVLGVLPFDFLK